LLSGIKRMALVAQLHMNNFLRRAGCKSIAAYANDLRIWIICGMDICFHNKTIIAYFLRDGKLDSGSHHGILQINNGVAILQDIHEE